jgi:TonB family protein
LKFVDLTEASRLQIKKWLSSNEAPPSGASELADFPAWRDGDAKSEISVMQNTVTPEIGQIRRSMTKSKSSRAPFPPRSRRITKLVVGELHENLAIPGSAKGDTSVEHPVLQRENPTGSAALAAMAERPMSPVEGEVAEVEAIGVVSLGPPNERKEPTKKAAFEPVNPTLVPEQSDELVQEIKKWLESVSAELRQSVPIQGPARDGASVHSLPQLEQKAEPAVFRAMDVANPRAPEAKASRVTFPNRAMPKEGEEPVTNASEMQASDAPQSSAVAPKRGKHLVGEIKKLFVNELIDEELDQNDQTEGPTKGHTMGGAPLEHSVPQIKKKPEWAAFGEAGLSEVKLVEPNTISLAPLGSSLHSMTRESASTPATAGPGQDDKLVQALRSSFGQSEVEGKSEESALDREILGRWILASAVLFLLIVSLAAARWIYVTPAFDKISSASDIAKMVSNMSTASDPVKTLPAPSYGEDIPKVKRKSNSRNGSPGNAGGRAAAGRTAQYATQTKSPPESQPEKFVSAKTGHVSLLPATDLPEKIILPAYPAEALQKNLQGRVVLKALISEDGTLRNIELVGAPSLLSSAVLEAVRKWRYRPHMQNGVPVQAETQITIDFEK